MLKLINLHAIRKMAFGFFIFYKRMVMFFVRKIYALNVIKPIASLILFWILYLISRLVWQKSLTFCVGNVWFRQKKLPNCLFWQPGNFLKSP